ncbi:MAG: LysM peptidoglycan-binding domain-containing protein [Lachnospiraceae bacterium]|nr:LysM peptidoglycan-binding domain-containing protein [Lachnospiraceae bacterium]
MNNQKECLVRLPRNVRKIGMEDKEISVYIEDYLYSYIQYIARNTEKENKIIVLIGHALKLEGKFCVFAYGAICATDVIFSSNSQVEAWKNVYAEMEKYYKNGEVIGIAEIGSDIIFTKEKKEALQLFHNDIRIEFNSIQRKINICVDEKNIDGYYIYYEKNDEMQEYMLMCKGEVEPERKDNQLLEEIREKINQMSLRKQKKTMTKRCVIGTFVCVIMILLIVEMQDYFHKDSTLTTMKQEQINAKKQRENKTLEVNRNENGTDKKEGHKEKIESLEKKYADDEENNKNSLEKHNTEMELIQFYEVKPGDSLEGICREYFGNITAIGKIMQINQIENKNRIVVGQVLKMWE